MSRSYDLNHFPKNEVVFRYFILPSIICGFTPCVNINENNASKNAAPKAMQNVRECVKRDYLGFLICFFK